MKFQVIAKKNKAAIISVVIILFIAVMSIAMFKFDVNVGQYPISSCIMNSISPTGETIALNQGQILVQNYINNGIDYKEIGFDVKTTDGNAIIEFEVSDSLYTQKKTFKGNELSSDGYTFFRLDKELRASDSENLSIKITAKEGNFDLAVGKPAETTGGSCYIDDKAIDSDIVINLRTMSEKRDIHGYIVLSVATIVFLILIAVAVKITSLKIEAITAFMLAFFCGVCLFIFPPFTVPDERTHYVSAYHISNCFTFNFSDTQDALVMRECDEEYINNYSNSVHNREYISENGFNKTFADKTEKVTSDCGYISGIKASAYLCSGLGIAAARAIGLGPYYTFQMARIFNAAMCVILIYFAMKLMPFGKIAVAAISLLPISLHITASVSYDNFTFGGIMLLFAYIMNLMYSDKKIGWKNILILTAMLIIIVSPKVVYIGVAAILLIIPKEKFKVPKYHLAIKIGLGLITVCAVLLLQIGSISTINANAVSNGYTLSYIIKNPFKMCSMLLLTVLTQCDFYLKSMISYFGWFEFETAWYVAVPYVVAVAFAFMRKKGEPHQLDTLQRCYSLLLFTAVFLLTELALLMDHTDITSQIVLGVQGRYFIPALPLIFLFVRSDSVELSADFDRKLLFAIGVLNSFTFIYSAAKIV